MKNRVNNGEVVQKKSYVVINNIYLGLDLTY